MMGLSDGPKSFRIGLVVLIQYWLWQTASHPPSHVAIAITLNAEASSLKSLYKASGSLVCESCEALIKDDENNDNDLDTGHGVSLWKVGKFSYLGHSLGETWRVLPSALEMCRGKKFRPDPAHRFQSPLTAWPVWCCGPAQIGPQQIMLTLCSNKTVHKQWKCLKRNAAKIVKLIYEMTISFLLTAIYQVDLG